MIKKLTSLISRLLFIISFAFIGIAVCEKFANFFGFTLTRGYHSNWQLLEYSAIAILFVIALQLREIKLSLPTNNM